ncbi:MAG: LamB/YcsF family protein [Acidimicrobiales bacterium]
MTATVDLNADLGEGFGAWSMGDDDGLLSVVSSANVACGFHAGDPQIMRRVCTIAVARGVALGAHVAYRDLAGFGRRALDVPVDDIRDDVLYQLAALDGFARAAGGAVRYLKPHGALYNRAVDDPGAASAVVGAATDFGGGIAVLALPGSELLRAAAAAGLEGVEEGYVDRAYDDRGRLVPRSQKGAVLHDVDAMIARTVRMATTGTVAAAGGADLDARIRSLCVHGDTPGALDMARRVRAGLEAAGVTIRPFTA